GSRRVGADEIPLHQVTGRTAVGAIDDETKATISGDKVARARRRSPDRVVRPTWAPGFGDRVNHHPEASIAEFLGPECIRTDVITLYQVPRRLRVGQIDTVEKIAGNQIPRALRYASDGIIRRKNT